MIFDVAIIGGGLPGCSAALHLRQRHASVVLLERRRCGSQASGVNYGGVRQQGRHEAELPLARRSRRIWAHLRELVGDNCEFMATGHLKLARSDEQAHELERYATIARKHGLALDLLNRGQLQNRYPYLDGEAIAGSLCAEDGQANPRLVAPAFARAARAMGAEIREHTEVEGATRSGATFHIACRDGTTVAARCIINVAGAWGSSVAAWFGESAPEEVMAPNMCVTEPLPYFLQPNLGVCGGDIYIRQIPRGNVIFGGGSGVADKVAIKARPLSDATRESAMRAIKLVPRLRNALLIRSWTGIEGCMPDMLPVVGPSMTTPGLLHAFGFSGHGFQLGPAVGAVLAELALDGRTATPIDAFSIDRFRRAGTSVRTIAATEHAEPRSP